MTKQRFDEHFSTGSEGVIICPQDGEPRRLDGQPLTEADKDLIAGKDPLAERLAPFKAQVE